MTVPGYALKSHAVAKALLIRKGQQEGKCLPPVRLIQQWMHAHFIKDYLRGEVVRKAHIQSRLFR